MRHTVAAFFAAMAAAVALAGAASAIPDQGTPEFDQYLQGLERNGYNLNPDTAWRVAHRRPGYASSGVGVGNMCIEMKCVSFECAKRNLCCEKDYVLFV